MHEVAIEIEPQPRGSGRVWRVSIEHTGGKKVESVLPVDDSILAGLAGVPVGTATWQGFLGSLSPNARWQPSLPLMRQVGRLLFDRVLASGKLRAHLEAVRSRATTDRRPLRIAVNVARREECPDPVLDVLPVEMAWEDTSFTFRRVDEPVIRCDFALPHRNLALADSCRVLVVTAHSDTNPEPTREALSDHAARVVAAIEGVGWVAEPMPDATAEALQVRLRANPGIDFLYVVAHGTSDPDMQGWLALRGEALSGSDLGRWLRDDPPPDGRRVQAAVLCACSSAAPTSAPETAGMAQWLVDDAGGRLTAAVGFRGPVGVPWALGFSESLFRELAGTRSLETAFANARRQTPEHDPQWALALYFGRRSDPGAALPRLSTTDLLGRLLRAPVAAPPFPRQPLPRAPRPFFTGRKEELAALRSWLRSPGRALVTALAAGGGLGKTELALMTATEARDAGTPVLWLSAAEAPQRDMLLSMIRVLEPAFETTPDTSDDALRDHMRTKLGNVRGLLVLDDVRRAGLVDGLTPSDAWNVLVTTRDETLVPGVRPIELRPFEGGEGARMLSRVAWDADQPPPDQKDAASALVERLGGVPLALEMTGASIRARGDGSAASYLAELNEGRGKAAEDLDAVQRVLLRSLGDLDERTRFALHVVARFPAAGIETWQMAAALSEPEPVAQRRLQRLVRMHVATWNPGTSRFTLHPLNREASRKAASIGSEDGNSAAFAAAVAMNYTSRWIDSAVGSRTDLAHERWRRTTDQFDGMDTNKSELPIDARPLVAQAIASVDQYRQFEVRGALRFDWINAAEQLAPSGSDEVRGQVLLARAVILCATGDRDEAEKDFDRALSFFEAVGDRLGQANALIHRGELRSSFRDDRDGAEKDFDRALSLFEAVGNRIGQANALRSRGFLHRFRGDLDGAEKDYQRALSLFEAVGDRVGQANTLNVRGNLRRFRGDPDGAENDYERALPLFEAVGDRVGQANTLSARGDLRRSRKDRDGAEQDYERALSLFEAGGQRLGQANALKARGDLRRFHDDLNGAEGDYELSLSLCGSVGDRLGQANALQGLGDLEQNRRNDEKAFDFYRRALAMYEAIQDVLGASNVYAELAKVCLQVGDIEQARAAASNALEVGRRCSNRYAINVASKVEEIAAAIEAKRYRSSESDDDESAGGAASAT